MPELERYLTDHGGFGAFIALLVLKVGEMLFKYFTTRDANLKTLQCTVEKTNNSVVALEKDLKVFKNDLRKAFIAVKTISGDKWPDIVKEFDDLQQDH